MNCGTLPYPGRRANPRCATGAAGAAVATVQANPLQNYRIIAFATHALLPGELDCLTDPALALTPGGSGKTDSGLEFQRHRQSEAGRRLGAAVGLQYGGRRRRVIARRGFIRAGDGVFLCGHALAAGVALGGCFGANGVSDYPDV